MSPPRVSVVIIFLNAESFIEEAIRSVLAQTYTGWELFLVDDGSTDRSMTIAREYAAEQPRRIKYLKHDGHKNRGMSASRNLGAAHAAGAYLIFLDADDVLRPEAISTLLARLEAEPHAAMVYGPVEYWYEWPGNPTPCRRNFVQRLGVASNVLLKPPVLFLRFLRREAAAPSGMLVRAEMFRDVGGFEQAFRGMYEDQAFCSKICLRYPVVAVDSCVYRYRQHGGSSSMAADRSGTPDFGRNGFLAWLEQYLLTQAPNDRQLRRAVQAERRWLRYPRLHRTVRRIRRRLRRLVS